MSDDLCHCGKLLSEHEGGLMCCPWCGARAHLILNGAYVACSRFHCPGSTWVSRELWNRRPWRAVKRYLLRDAAGYEHIRYWSEPADKHPGWEETSLIVLLPKEAGDEH